jgi:hypothetical protein
MLVAGKLTALVGLPALVLFSIYAGGVYLGAIRADQVVELEQRWLGVTPPPGRLTGSDRDGPPLEADPSDEPTSTETAPDLDEPDQPDPTEPTPTEPTPTEPTPTEPTPTEPTPTEVAGAIPVAAATPVGPELRSRFAETKQVRVDLLVDPALVAARPDWLDYVAELFAATQTSFERLYGIELQLHGVRVWDAAVGAELASLEAQLRAQADAEPDGETVVVGLLARAAPNNYSPPTWTGDETGTHALVFADLGAADRDRYSINFLRALSLLFGAEPTSETSAVQSGSFMAEGVRAAAPVLDPENRGKVIINKRRALARPEPDEPEPDDSPKPKPKPKDSL